MCGFAGWLALRGAPPLRAEALRAAGVALTARGPDSGGFYEEPGIGLAHRRLAILDLSPEAHQPMVSGDGRYVLAYNGEILNFRHLRKELEQHGVAFRTRSDTEVLLRIWEEEGPACLPRLNGFFAFAIWDTLKKELFLARDRMGIKPLYYGWRHNYLVFGSEPKALLPLWGRPELNLSALAPYFMLTYIPAPLSAFKDIYKLPPGTWMKISDQGPSEPNFFWKLPSDPAEENLTLEEAKEQLRTTLSEVLEDWLVADVPVGIFLSGGLDSAVLTLAAARRHPEVATFSIGFKDEPFYDETRYARLLAQKAGVPQKVFSLSLNDLLDILPSVLDYFDEPFADSSALAVSILSREVRKEVTVALSGDGGDELFGGYQKHVAEAIIQRYPVLRRGYFLLPLLRLLPHHRSGPWANRVRQLIRLMEGARLKPCRRYLAWASYGHLYWCTEALGEDFKKAWFQYAENFCAERSWEDGVQSTLLADLQLVLANDMLVKTDRMSMMHSLEVRPPLLDNRMVDLALRIPPRFKCGPGFSKKILRDAFQEELPPEIYARGKRGFEVPLRKWFLGPLKSVIEKDYLDPDFLEHQKIFNPKAAQHLIKKLAGPDAGDSAWWLWSLIVFQHWYKKHLN